MLRTSCIARAEATTVKGGVASAAGRLIRIRKKSKWIDRRSTRVANNGKDVWNFGEQPSCALCHVRFRYKQDYESHKDSELHQNRVRWVETMNWWKETGEPSYLKEDEKTWEWFKTKILPEKAKEMGCSVEEASRVFRQAKMVETPSWHRFLQYPKAKEEIVEPRDQRWPSSPKW